MAKCSGITGSGARCKGIATPGSDYCYAHDPARAEERRRNATRGGKRGGRGRPSVELARLQRRFEELADKVLSGDIERGVGAVAGQLLNGARACVRDGLTAREQEELVERLEALEAALESRQGSGRGGGGELERAGGGFREPRRTARRGGTGGYVRQAAEAPPVRGVPAGARDTCRGGPMGSIERRLADLERRFGPPPDDPAEKARLEEQREAFRVRLERIREQAEREEAETGDDRRRRALEDLEEHMRRRVEERRCRGA